MSIVKYTKNWDELVVVLSVLKQLNADEIDTLKNRIKAQKCQYIAQVFKVSPVYSFNLYIHGPYSPDLAKDLFTFNQSDVKIRSFSFVAEELKSRFELLKAFISDKTSRQLELIATYHWLREAANIDDTTCKQKLSKWKDASLNEIAYTEEQYRKMWK